MAILQEGQKINRYTITSFSHKDKKYRKFYNAKCDCGTEKIINGALLVSGNTKSCGCWGKEERRKRNLLPDNLGVKRQIILQYKRHARDREIEYLISESDFILILPQNCFYCNLPPSNNKVTKNCSGFLYSGVDRKDSYLGYTKENCVPCCAKCNKAKLSMSINDFFNWIKLVYNHSIKS